MKIVCMQNSLAVAAGAEQPRIVLGADSALLRCGEPVFLPDDGIERMSRVVPAFRVGRLGLNIPAAAAEQYVDAHTLFHLLQPAAEGYDTALWGMADRSFSPGAWQEGSLPQRLDAEAVSTELYRSEGELGRASLAADLPEGFCGILLHALSRYATFKTGDVVLTADLQVALPATPDSRLQARLGSMNLLNLKIK